MTEWLGFTSLWFEYNLSSNFVKLSYKVFNRFLSIIITYSFSIALVEKIRGYVRLISWMYLTLAPHGVIMSLLSGKVFCMSNFTVLESLMKGSNNPILWMLSMHSCIDSSDSPSTLLDSSFWFYTRWAQYWIPDFIEGILYNRCSMCLCVSVYERSQ